MRGEEKAMSRGCGLGHVPFSSLPNTSNGHDEARLVHAWEKQLTIDRLFSLTQHTYFDTELGGRLYYIVVD